VNIFGGKNNLKFQRNEAIVKNPFEKRKFNKSEKKKNLAFYLFPSSEN